VICFLCLTVPAQVGPQPMTLVPGQPVERAIAGAESHVYQIALTAGQFVRVTLDQIGRDMSLALEAPDGKSILDVDLNRPSQPETIAFVPEGNGEYRLVVRAKGTETLRGLYVLRLLIRPLATKGDRERIAFEALTREAASLSRNRVTAQQALDKAQQALAFWRQTGERFWEGKTLLVMAGANSNLDRYEPWKDCAEQGLRIAHELKDRALEAGFLYSLAVHASHIGKSEEALPIYEQVRAAARDSKDRAMEATALIAAGSDNYALGRYEKAVDDYEQALPIVREEKNRDLEANALHNLGSLLIDLSRYEEALKNLELALPIYREVKDLGRESGVFIKLGDLALNLGGYDSAVTHYERALAISREAKDYGSECVALQRLATALLFTGQYDLAMANTQKALDIARERGYRRCQNRALWGLGSAHKWMGNYETAISYFEQSLVIAREIKDRGSECDNLNELSITYGRLGRADRSIEFSEQALGIARELKNPIIEIEALTYLSTAMYYLGHYDKQKMYQEQALAIARQNKNRAKEAEALDNIGLSQYQLGKYEAALTYYEQALAVNREIRDRVSEGENLQHIGIVFSKLGRTEKALEYGELALRMSQEFKQRAREREALHLLATAERDRGNLNRARLLIQQGLQITESLRAQISSQESRASYLASVHDDNEFYIDLLMRLHKAEPRSGGEALAFEASEQSRARVLLEQMTEAGTPIRQGVDARLIERERSAASQLNARAEQRTRLLAGQPKPQELAEINETISALEVELERAQAAIRQSSPRYAALAQPQPLTLKQVQDQLDADTLLLEYALGEERSYLWAITRDSLASYELPKSELIEKDARQVYELLTARSTRQRGESPQQRQESIAQAEAKLPAAARALGQTLLAPVAAQLGNKRLVIVADGALQYIPFGMLPEPSIVSSPLSVAKNKGQRTTDNGQPLIVGHEVVSLPSASALAIQRAELAGRHPAPKLLAVIADPVFDRTDARLKMLATDAGDRAQTPNIAYADARSIEHLAEKTDDKAGSTINRLVIPRLPFTHLEATRLLALTPRTSSFGATDFQASRATVLSGDLSQYRYVHFATHGLLDSERPGLSSLVLSMVDAAGKPVDGFLRANDIYNLKLPAELVVLSACETGLGKEIKGEGLVGLTRGFMYAGAARVVVSLWNVNDKATADLMAKFYERMLKQGERPAAALRAAQVEMWKQKQWQSPYYWAAFTMQGEWR
jgi:CHAT domain-containing protein/tetratricopeptide (TPR) repeat protein